MKALRIGDIVVIVKGRGSVLDRAYVGKMDIVQEAKYSPSQDTMDYSLFNSGAWWQNENLRFHHSDRLKSLRYAMKEESNERSRINA